VDVRVVSATHQKLEQYMADKLFRQDLCYRLKGIELLVPPLRHRQEDIVLLANSFLDAGMSFSPDAISAMLNGKWPGNVREIKQRVQAAVALCESKVLPSTDLDLALLVQESPTDTFSEYDN